MPGEPWYRVAGTALRRGGRPDHSEVIPELIVGEYPTPDDAEWLREELEVGVVLNLQDEGDLSGKFLEVDDLYCAYQASEIVFHHRPVADGDHEGLHQRLDELVELLHESIDLGHRVYLHCNAGMNRAPTVAIAYLHVHRGFSLNDAIAFVKRSRPCVPYASVLRLHYEN